MSPADISSSYQDVEWGHPAELPVTDAPITFKQLQIILNKLGYYLSRHDPGRKIIHWHKESGTDNPITTLRPDFQAIGYTEPVYERDYVLDLLLSIGGGNNDDDGHKLLAVLISDEKEPY